MTCIQVSNLTFFFTSLTAGVIRSLKKQYTLFQFNSVEIGQGPSADTWDPSTTPPWPHLFGKGLARALRTSKTDETWPLRLPLVQIPSQGKRTPSSSVRSCFRNEIMCPIPATNTLLKKCHDYRRHVIKLLGAKQQNRKRLVPRLSQGPPQTSFI